MKGKSKALELILAVAVAYALVTRVPELTKVWFPDPAKTS